MSSPGQLRPLLDQFASSAATDLWLCLGPGDYDLGKGTQMQGKRSLRITGVGSSSVSIGLSSDSFEIAGRGKVFSPALAISAEQVTLEGLSFRFGSGESHLLLRAEHLKVEDCRFERLANALGEARYSMVSVVAPSGGDCDMRIRDCQFDARYRVSTLKQLGLAEAGVTGTSALGKSFIELMKSRDSTDTDAFEAALTATAGKVMSMSFAKRSKWAAGITPVVVEGPATPIVGTIDVGAQPRASADDTIGRRLQRKRSGQKLVSADLAKLLANPGADATALAQGIGALIANAVSFAADYALRLASPRVGGLIASSDLDGWLLLASNKDATVVVQGALGSGFSGSPIDSAGSDLELHGNRMVGVNMLLSSGETGDGTLMKPIGAYNQLVWNGNRLRIDSDNEFQNLAARTWMAQGNDLGMETRISVFSNRACVVGNVATGSGIRTLASANLERAGNLGVGFFSL